MHPPKPNTFIPRRSPFTTPTPAAPPRRACSGAKFGARLVATLDELIGALTAADTLAGLRDVIVRGQRATLGLAQPLRASLPQELHSTFDTLGERLAEGNSDLRALEGGRLTALTALDVAWAATAVQDAQPLHAVGAGCWLDEVHLLERWQHRAQRAQRRQVVRGEALGFWRWQHRAQRAQRRPLLRGEAL